MAFNMTENNSVLNQLNNIYPKKAFILTQVTYAIIPFKINLKLCNKSKFSI
jgi:hypothetical protein